MKGSMKVAKGRIEEAAGALVGNDKLRARGQADQAMGQIIRAGEKDIAVAGESARKIVEEAKDGAKDAVEHAKQTK